MQRRGRQICIVVRQTLVETWDRKRGKRTRTVNPVVLDLRDSCVVEAEIGEVRRRVTLDAIPGVVGGSAPLSEKDLQARQLFGAKTIRLAVEFELPVSGVG